MRTSETEHSSTRFVDVLAPVALDRAYSYRVPAGLFDLKPGDMVSRCRWVRA